MEDRKNKENQNIINEDENKTDDCDDDDDNDDGNDDDDDEQDGDTDGWITPGNISKVKKKMGVNDEVLLKDSNIKCVCLTTDFAMQVRFLTPFSDSTFLFVFVFVCFSLFLTAFL